MRKDDFMKGFACPDEGEVVWRPHTPEDATRLINGLARELETEWLRRGFDSPEIRMRMVLEEGVLNAWIHGNGMDRGKSVTVRWRFDSEFHLEIIDEGPGFDHENPPDPTCGENLTKPCGRGIFIIKYFANHVYWTHGGCRMVAVMEKSGGGWSI